MPEKPSKAGNTEDMPTVECIQGREEVGKRGGDGGNEGDTAKKV